MANLSRRGLLSSFNLFCLFESFALRHRAHRCACAGAPLRYADCFSVFDRCSVLTLRAQPRVSSSLRRCPPNIPSIMAEQDEVFELQHFTILLASECAILPVNALLE